MDHIIISLCSNSLVCDEKAKEIRNCVTAIPYTVFALQKIYL